jgi:hypothetical protein
MTIDFSNYEGSCFEENNAEIYVIEREGVDILRIPKLEAADGILQCDFESFDPDLSFDDIKGLVYVVLLGKFLRRFYLGKVNFVKFKNLATGEESQNVYLG